MISHSGNIDFETIHYVLFNLICKVRAGKGSQIVYRYHELHVSRAKLIERCYISQVVNLFNNKDK